MKFLGEISSNWANDLLVINVQKTIESYWCSLLIMLQWTNTTSVISIWGTVSTFLSLVISLLMLASNLIVFKVISRLYSKCNPIFFLHIFLLEDYSK